MDHHEVDATAVPAVPGRYASCNELSPEIGEGRSAPHQLEPARSTAPEEERSLRHGVVRPRAVVHVAVGDEQVQDSVIVRVEGGVAEPRLAPAGAFQAGSQ